MKNWLLPANPWTLFALGLLIGSFAGATAAMQAGPETVVGALVQARADENTVRSETWRLEQRAVALALGYPCTLEKGQLVLRTPLVVDPAPSTDPQEAP